MQSLLIHMAWFPFFSFTLPLPFINRLSFYRIVNAMWWSRKPTMNYLKWTTMKAKHFIYQSLNSIECNHDEHVRCRNKRCTSFYFQPSHIHVTLHQWNITMEFYSRDSFNFNSYKALKKSNQEIKKCFRLSGLLIKITFFWYEINII